MRRRAGRDDIGPGGHSLAVDLQRLFVDEAGMTVSELEPVRCGHVGVLGPPESVDQFLLLRHQCRQVDACCTGRDAWERVGQRPLPMTGSREQCLTRDAANVEARPAEDAVLDQQDGLAA